MNKQTQHVPSQEQLLEKQSAPPFGLAVAVQSKRLYARSDHAAWNAAMI